MAKKCTKIQRQERERAVMELLLSDTPRADILEYGGKTWGVRRSAIDGYIKEASEMIKTEGNLLRRQAFDQHLAKLKHQRWQALESGDARLGFEILKDIAKLLGLYPAKEKRVTNLDIDMSELSNEQLQRIAAGDDPASVLASERKTV